MRLDEHISDHPILECWWKHTQSWGISTHTMITVDYYNGPSPDFCVSSEVVGQKFYMGLEMRI
jgi:hypothetical protein